MRLGKEYRLPGFRPTASILVSVAFQSMPRMADWVGGKPLSNLLTHIPTQTHPKPLWLNTPEMCTQTFFYFFICVELQGNSHFMSVPCHQAAAECVCPSCGSRAGMRVTVFANIWEGVYVLMPVWIHTHRGCEWSRFRLGLPAQLVRHWPPPEWSRSPTTGRMRWALQTASLIPGRPTKWPNMRRDQPLQEWL